MPDALLITLEHQLKGRDVRAAAARLQEEVDALAALGVPMPILALSVALREQGGDLDKAVRRVRSLRAQAVLLTGAPT